MTVANRALSEEVRARTAADHACAERAPVISALMSGAMRRPDIARMTAQYWHVYRALEDATDRLGDRRLVAAFDHPALRRTPHLAADLRALLGRDWSDAAAPSAATDAYVERLSAVATTGPGWLAHHYTRYLGDLSGGQVIGEVLRARYGLHDATAFHRFELGCTTAAFRVGYRYALDALDWSTDERERFLREVRVAYHHNLAMLGG